MSNQLTAEDRLQRMAEVAVRIGVGLAPGQDLLISGNTATLHQIRAIAAEAYKAGAATVTPMLSDDAITLARFEHAHDASFDEAAEWYWLGQAEAFKGNAARLHVSGENPMLLSGQDPDKVSRAARAGSRAGKPAMKYITEFAVNWSIVAYPGAAWAQQVFPDLPEAEAVEALGRAIFEASRLTGDDPVADWKAHDAELKARRDWLNTARFDALCYSGPGTQFTLGLAEGHSWEGGSGTAKNGLTCMPNIPTEEVFTTPDCRRAEGTVRASKPLAHNGTLIRDIEVRFEGGRIVEARASSGEEVFRKLIETDEGAARLGEVALVPHSSPISASGLLFYNTLFDENAASHIALGQCYTECFVDQGLSEEEVEARGGNSSLIHVDWMIGSGELDVDGLDAEGNATPVMRKGEWAVAL